MDGIGRTAIVWQLSAAQRQTDHLSNGPFTTFPSTIFLTCRYYCRDGKITHILHSSRYTDTPVLKDSQNSQKKKTFYFLKFLWKYLLNFKKNMFATFFQKWMFNLLKTLFETFSRKYVTFHTDTRKFYLITVAGLPTSGKKLLTLRASKEHPKSALWCF